MDIFLIITSLVIVSAIYSYINARFIKLPGTIGIFTIASIVSIVTIAIDKLDVETAHYFSILAKNINFSGTVLNIMLGFLLFAGSFNSDTNNLKREMRPLIVLSTVSVILSTVVFGTLFYYSVLLLNIHIHIPFVYCLLFGALISPTDPIAVGAIVKKSKLPQNLATIISGESLFNDGLSLVLFITAIEIIRSGVDHLTFVKVGLLFAQEVLGGITLGLVFGFIAFRIMKSITDFQTIVLISLSLVMGVSVLAAYLHLSIPLATVSAGLLAGNRTINKDVNEQKHEMLENFWHLIEEILNTVLFVMIGLQMVNLPYITNYWITGGVAIVIILIARWLSILFPLTFLRRPFSIRYNNINILTWAGLRGGISIALALSLPESPYRYIILSACYFIVIFSIVVQGLTLNKVIERSLKNS